MEKPVIKQNRRMSHLEVLQLHAALKNLKNVPGVKLNYAIARTIQNLKPLVEAYNQKLLIPKSESFLEYEAKLKEAYELLSAKGTGKPQTRIIQTVNGDVESFDIDPNSDEAKQTRAKLQWEYREAIELRKSEIKEYNEWLEEECDEEIKLHKVSINEMPQGETEDYKSLWDACSPLIADVTDS